MKSKELKNLCSLIVTVLEIFSKFLRILNLITKKNFHGNISQLNEFININKVNEVIFCAKDISAENIIYSMAVVNSKKNIDFKIIPEKLSLLLVVNLFILMTHISLQNLTI